MERKNVNFCEIIRAHLLDNIAKLKKTKNVVFRFENLLTHLFFYVAKKFPGVSTWDNECVMKVVTQCYQAKLENIKDNDIDWMMKSFQSEMKLRYKIPPSMVEK